MTRPRQIVAFGGGGFSMEAGNPLLDDYVLGLATASGRDRPSVCFLPTASGDADHYVVRFYRHFTAARCEPSHISLFRRDRGVADIREHLLSQDLVYVGGGSVVSLLGVWRAHGVDAALRDAWEAGVVMAGLSAGSLCWFAEAMSGYHGECTPVRGMEFLPWSNAVHYDKEPHRRPAFHAALARGCRAASRRRTARRCTSSARSSRAWCPSRRERARLPRRRRGRRGGRAAAAGDVPRRRRGARPCRLTRRCPPPSAPQPGARRAGRVPTIFAMGGGGFTMEPENPALDEYVRALAPAREPRICLLPTAGGDSEDQIRRFYTAFADQLCKPTHVSLFRLGAQRVPLREHLLAQDVVYVGGGSMINLLALWRAHGVDAILREAWQAGIVLAGLSAGSMCWFEHGITTSTGAPARPRGLGFLPGSNSVHHDGEPARRPVFLDAVARGRHPARLGRRRRRRAAVPRDAGGGGRDLPPRRARLPRARGRGRGGGGGDRAARAHALRPRGSQDATGRHRAPRVAGGPAGPAGLGRVSAEHGARHPR